MIFFNKKEKDELIFLRQYTHDREYDPEQRIKYESIDYILKYFRKLIDIDKFCNVVIESKFKNVIYPFFDLDSKSKYELFKTLYVDIPYVIFISSYNDEELNDEKKYHYWGIIDKSYKNIKELILNQNWKICNDEKYVKYSTYLNKLMIRGLYENKNRKPKLFEKNGNLSKNLELFISKLENHYKNNGFELSILKYKDPELLIQFDRKIKLKKINCNEKESDI